MINDDWAQGKSPDPFTSSDLPDDPVPQKAPSLRGMRILVVEDVATMRRIIRDLLRVIGYTNVVEAENGELALTLLYNEHFDFVITDLLMPSMSGLELLRAMRADSRLCNIPVLMITADAQREKIIEAARAGVNGYIVKPFTAAMLEGKILRILERTINVG